MATVLTYIGEEWACNRMAFGGDTTNDGHWVAWGTDGGVVDSTPTANKDDTALYEESPDEDRAIGIVSVVGTGQDAKYQVVTTLTVENNDKVITNAGNFNDAGDLIVHGDFTPIPMQVGDQITFTITIDPS